MKLTETETLTARLCTILSAGCLLKN